MRLRFDKTDFLTLVFLGAVSICWYFGKAGDKKKPDDNRMLVSVSGDVDGHAYVDLGLPSGTKWATVNVGAHTNDDCGSFFSWGETDSWKNYDTLTHIGKSADLVALDSVSDAAYVNWGTNWRMPSDEEQKELLDGCYWNWVDDEKSLLVGLLGTSKTNGNTIFLPVTGFSTSTNRNTISFNKPRDGFYLSSVLGAYPDSAFVFSFSEYKKARIVYGCCSDGFCVRAVVNDGTEKHTVSFYVDDFLICRKRVSVGADASIPDDEPPSLYGCKFLGWSDSSFTNVQKDLVVNARFQTKKKTEGGAMVSGQVCGHEYVDLGLASGTLWATCNVGGKAPSDYGDYFAWGETKNKDEYNMRSYKWYNYVDDLKELLPADDAASVNWGGKWRMPTSLHLKELYDGCFWTRVCDFNHSHVSGWVGQSKKNGNYIFLPAAGSYYGRELRLLGNAGFYLSSSIGVNKNHVDILYFTDSNMNWGSMEGRRFWGSSVRPVCFP